MTISISTFTTTDMSKIEEAYSQNGAFDLELLIADIQNNTTERVADVGVEDLISYYMMVTGELPPPLLESPDTYADLWQDNTEVMNTLQEWRRETTDNGVLVTALKTFLDNAGQSTGVIADAEAFTNEYLSENGLSTDFSKDATNLVTNLASLMMKFGNPAAALLAYVLGFDAKIHAEDVSDTTYSLENVSLTYDSKSPGQVTANGELVATENGEEGVSVDGLYGTADTVKGEQVAYVQNIGLGEVVRDLQETALDAITDSNYAYEDLIQDMANVDTSTPEGTAEIEEIRMAMDNIKKVMSAMQEFMKEAQDVLMSVIDTATTLNNKMSQNMSNTIRNFA